MKIAVTFAETRMSFFVMTADHDDRDESGGRRRPVRRADAEVVEQRVEEQPEHHGLQDAPVDVGDHEHPAEPDAERRRRGLPEPRQGAARRRAPRVHDRVAHRRRQHRHRDRREGERHDRAGDALHDPEVEIRRERKAHVGDPHDHQAREPERVAVERRPLRDHATFSGHDGHRPLPAAIDSDEARASPPTAMKRDGMGRVKTTPERHAVAARCARMRSAACSAARALQPT